MIIFLGKFWDLKKIISHITQGGIDLVYPGLQVDGIK